MSGKKNMFYAISANVISTFVSAFITLLLPKCISVESYGYFQYYLFWAGYLGMLHLGWIDGLYLVHCGEYYDSLRKDKISAQLRSFTAFQLTIGFIIVVYSLLFVETYEYKALFFCLGIALVATNVRLMLLYILQATARIKEYSISTILGLLSYLFTIIILLLLDVKNYEYYAFAHIISNFVPMLIGLFYCKEIVISKPVSVKESFFETIDYVKIGLNLLIANFASSWVIGVVRLMIEKKWDIATFGKISLTITISNLFMTLINAVALVLLPMLRRMDKDRIFHLYMDLNTILLSALFGGMMLYYPVEWVLSKWLPEYKDALSYMALLFPICVFESKNAMILCTYLKTLRKEKAIMVINVITVIFSAFISSIAVFLFKSLTLSMVCIVVVLAVRCVVFELYLKTQISIPIKKNVLLELLMSLIFIVCNWFLGGLQGLFAYIALYCIYLAVDKKDICNAYKTLFQKAYI